METAIFAAGCFWGVEQAFRQVKGVVDTAVGYTGGRTEDPTYEEVCSGRTGHAEAVKVTFDPDQVTYEELLDVFWAVHDPTQVNRQGPDIGTQYRSAIFTAGEAQAAQAAASRDALAARNRTGRAIATQIESAGPFYMAEDYHQQYFDKRGRAAGCRLW